MPPAGIAIVDTLPPSSLNSAIRRTAVPEPQRVVLLPRSHTTTLCPVTSLCAAERGATIRAPTPGSWAYAENFVPEDEVLARARARAGELGCTAVDPGTGAALRVLAAALQARAVVEIGTGAGVSALYLLQGMPADGVLTTIDLEAENQRAAREAFAEAGLRSNRTRLIPGRALDVLPRLTDGAYDLVLLDADLTEYGSYLQQVLRLLRPGGMLAVDNALWQSRVADPAQRDPSTTAVRELGKAIRDDDHLFASLLPCGDGLLLAVKR